MVIILKQIKKYPNLFASKEGHIYDIRKKCFLHEYSSNGYCCVYYQGKNLRVHRLVALAFIPNPENKPYIDHENTIKNDNRVENLHWVTQKENMNNSITRKHKKAVAKRQHRAYEKHCRKRRKRHLPTLYEWERYWWFTE